jgi:outer membrane PBP1 activator LpoA protein
MRLLGRLAELLERADAEAERVVAELVASWPDEQEHAGVDALQALIEDIEYEHALVLLDKLRQDLDQTSR